MIPCHLMYHLSLDVISQWVCINPAPSLQLCRSEVPNGASSDKTHRGLNILYDSDARLADSFADFPCLLLLVYNPKMVGHTRIS